MLGKLLTLLTGVTLIWTGCSSGSPDIRAICVRDNIGNYVIKWETNPLMEGSVKVEVSENANRFNGGAPVITANIRDGVATYITTDNLTPKYFRLTFNDRYARIIGARPAVGKSAFVTQMTLQFTGQGKRVGFYNLEMQEKQMYERFVVCRSGIGLTRLRRAKRFLGDEQERFREANEYLSGQEVIINTGGRTVGQIRNESRHMGYDVLIIDYLQLLRSDVKYQNRASEVGAISKALKEMAMELNIPVIALSQLNRLSEIKENKEPTMAELREAGDIEQDASIIILMWNLSEDRTKKGLKVDKNRQGELKKIVLEFDGNLMCFLETNETVKQAAGWTTAEEETPFG